MKIENEEMQKNFYDMVSKGIATDYKSSSSYTDLLYLIATKKVNDDDKEEWDKRGYDLCIKIKYFIESYRIDKYNDAMIGGFGQMCCAVQLFSNKTGYLKKFSDSLNQLFITNINEKLSVLKKDYSKITMENYDIICGVSGKLNYLLETSIGKKSLIKSTISDCIKYLIKLSGKHEYKNKLIYNFHIRSEQQFHKEESLTYPDGNFNLGLAHGIMGPLIVLSKAYKKGYREEGLLEAIKTYFDFYTAFRVERNGISYWPGQLSYKEYVDKTVYEKSVHYALSWCYGNVGIINGLMIVSKNLGWKETYLYYEEELLKVLNLPMNKYYVISPALCHGYASLLAIRVGMLNRCNDNRVVKRLNENIEKIIVLSNRNTNAINGDITLIDNDEGRLEGCMGDYSLLTGVTGIALVFQELIYGNNEYRKLLMLD